MKEQFFAWRQDCIENGELKSTAGRDTCWFKLLEHRKDDNLRQDWMDEAKYSVIRTWFEKPKTKESLEVTDTLEEYDQDLLAENVKLAMKVQKLQDTNRIERKAFRHHARINNALEEYNEKIINLLESYNLKGYTVHHEELDNKACGLVQLSDAHFNELISILGNKYDFKVAARRLKRLAIQVKKYFKAFDIRNILLAITGDLLNSDRRIDEFLNQATNRANASILTVILLKQFVLDLNQDFNVTIVTVSGNESRIKDELGYSDYVATDNYDFTVDNILRLLFKDCEGISFVDGDGDAFERVVNINGQNVLVTHGLDLVKGNTQTAVQAKIGMYALKGIVIDFIIYSHVHCPNVSNHSARASSLAGSNDYNEKALNLIGRASQNVYIFYKDKTRDAIVVDLQNVEGLHGYDIEKELEAYHSKSAAKTKSHTVIFQVVV